MKPKEETLHLLLPRVDTGVNAAKVPKVQQTKGIAVNE
jgi:hypothetical protein